MVATINLVGSPAALSPSASTSSPGSPPNAYPASVAAGGSSESVTISPAATLQLGQDQTIQAGKLVNQVDQTYAKQQAVLQQMDSQLQAIVKQFPPYGADDPQRIAYLQEFSGLRQIIDALQVPRDTQAELGLPQGVDLNGQGSLPQLPDLSGAFVSDQQVGEAVQQVQSAYAQVTAQREALAKMVETALGGLGYTSQVGRFS